MKKQENHYPYASRFGSHKSMIVESTLTHVICQDEFGLYETTYDYIDQNCCDPHRTSQNRLTKLFQGKKESK